MEGAEVDDLVNEDVMEGIWGNEVVGSASPTLANEDREEVALESDDEEDHELMWGAERAKNCPGGFGGVRGNGKPSP